MITRELKLRLTEKQEAELLSWFPALTSIYNWAVRRIELNAKDKIYFSKFDMKGALSGSCVKLGLPEQVIAETCVQAWTAWQRCFKKIGGKPRLKGQRNPLTSIPFARYISIVGKNHIRFCRIGAVKFFAQEIPAGKIKCARAIRRASGWYLVITIDTAPKLEVKETTDAIGIDPGFSTLLTLSNGAKIANPRELRTRAERLAQAQRGRRKQLSARLLERQTRIRRDRNHKISTNLVKNYKVIYYSDDNFRGMSRKFGKSVTEAALGNLIAMMAYKSQSLAGREVIAVSSVNSTKTCSNCGSLSGPSGLHGLTVRQWECACGAIHDRDINAARNILNAGLGCSLKAPVTEQATGTA